MGHKLSGFVLKHGLKIGKVKPASERSGSHETMGSLQLIHRMAQRPDDLKQGHFNPPLGRIFYLNI